MAETLDRQSARLLGVLSRRSPLDESELQQQLLLDLEPDTSVSGLCAIAAQNGWIVKHAYGWTLSDSGATILAQEGEAVSTEEEDVGVPPDHPLKPYDVAKLKVEQRTLSVFQALRKIEKQEIILDPEFQRAFVWDDVRQSRLIESILIRIPLPAFYLDATDAVRWSVVDGLQRLSTLDRFCRKEGFALTGLEFLTELAGLRFHELPRKYQVLIEDDTQLIFNNLLPGTPIKAKFTIFSRVNTGGMQLTPQEIRHALQQGKITRLLRVITNTHEFLVSTGRSVESARMTDREVALRALAFMAFGYDQYREFDDLNGFLVDAMEKFNSEFSDHDLDALTDKFKDSMLKVYAIFGRFAFRKFYQIGGRRGPFNKALFEAWVSAVTPYPIGVLTARKNAIQESFMAGLAFDSEFVRSITTSTGQWNAVKTRFKAVARILESATRDN